MGPTYLVNQKGQTAEWPSTPRMNFNFLPGIHACSDIYVEVDFTPQVLTLLAIFHLGESHLFRDSIKELFEGHWQRERQKIFDANLVLGNPRATEATFRIAIWRNFILVTGVEFFVLICAATRNQVL